MSLADIQVTAIKIDDVVVTVQSPPQVALVAPPELGVVVIAAGNVGPPGPAGKWVSMSQEEYDAIIEPDPETLYVIVG